MSGALYSLDIRLKNIYIPGIISYRITTEVSAMSDVYENAPCEYVRDLAERVNKAQAGGQHTVNAANMAKFNAVYDFFCWLAEDSGVEVKTLDVRPESIHASLSVEIPNVDLHGDDMARFVDTLQYVDVFSVGQTTSGDIVIDVCVNNVWEE